MKSSEGVELKTFLIEAYNQSPVFLPASITAFIALVGAVVAIFTLRSNSHFHRSKNAIDFEKTLETDDHYKNHISNLSSFKKLTSEDAMALRELVIKSSIDKSAHDSILEILNIWERCANGIRNHVYKEKVLRKVYCTHLVRLGDYLMPFIVTSRIHHKNIYIYEQVEWLYKKWVRKRKLEDIKQRTFLVGIVIIRVLVIACITFLLGLSFI